MWKNPRVWSLAIAETIAWAGIFYLFPAMLMRWEAYFGWSRVELTFGFTGALIISAGTGVFAGRLIDRGHGRILMTVSAFTGGLLVAMLPLLQHLWQFYLIWLLPVRALFCLFDTRLLSPVKTTHHHCHPSRGVCRNFVLSIVQHHR